MFIVCSIYLLVLGVLALCSNLAIFFLYIRVKAVTTVATTCDSVQDNLQHNTAHCSWGRHSTWCWWTYSSESCWWQSLEFQLIFGPLQGTQMCRCGKIYLQWSYFRYGWDMGSAMCQATGFLLTFLGIAAIFNLTAISLFRYYVITWREVTENQK